jgi:signal peptidase I
VKKALAFIAGEFIPGLNFILMGKPLHALALWAFIYASILVLWLTLSFLGGSRIACWTYVIGLFSVITLCNLYHPRELPPIRTDRRLKHLAFGVIIVAASLVIFQRIAGMQYRVKSPSMEPTLVIGANIVADPFSYGLFGKKIGRGDIVIHQNPNDSVTLFIHRIVGIPGDSVEIGNGRISINGAILERSRIQHNETRNQDRMKQLEPELGACVRGLLPGSHCSGLMTEYRWRSGSVGWRLPGDGYFVVGDNVYESYDSKYYGVLDRKRIKSRVICYGIDAELDSGTFSRMGRKID